MKKRSLRRVLAAMLACAMILCDFLGSGFVSNAADIPAIWSVKADKATLPGAGGEVEVTVSGEYLSGTLYYRLYKKDSQSGYYVKEVDTTPVSVTGTTAEKIFSVTIPKNETTEEETWQVWVNYENVPNGWSKSGSITVAVSTGETPTPSVDKTELQAAIATAENKKKADYTATSWAAMQEKLTAAKNINEKADATEEEVKNATTELNAAISALKLSAIPAIWSVKVDKTTLPGAGGEVEVTVSGENLSETLYYRLYKKDAQGGYYVKEVDTTSVNVTGTTAEKKFSVTIPKNETTEEETWQVWVNYENVPNGWSKSTGITVAVPTVDKTELQAAIATAESKNEADYTVTSWAAMQEKLDAAKAVNAKANASENEVLSATADLKNAIAGLVVLPVSNPKVEVVLATPVQLSAKGGTVTLAVSGKNLTASNWGIEVHAYVQGTDFNIDNRLTDAIQITDVTATGAKVTIPSAPMTNEIEYRISVGIKDGASLKETKTAIVYQEGKAKTESLLPELVELKDETTIVVTFDKNVEVAAESVEELKQLIYVADFGNEAATKISLGAEDTVVVNGNAVEIKFANPLSLSVISRVYVQEGALKVSGGNIVDDFSWTITSKPSVSAIVLDKETYDYNGGTVVARLKGVRVNEIAKEKIKAEVFLAEDSTATAIPVSITVGEEPVLTFDVPKNTTNRTQCYLLRVTIDGVPVYEATVENPAQKAVVSVLPKDTSDNVPTLGGMTITGNNSESSEGDLKNLTVRVLENVGELKVMLRLYGTNLDDTVTKVRAIDENGIIWPVYNIPECDGTIRFVAIAYLNGNGVVGDGNSQLIEILPPRYAGTNKTYKIQVAIDGENFLEVPFVTLTVKNDGITGEADFTPCGPSDIKEVIVKYVDETGKELAPADVYQGYTISMVQGFDIAPKAIEGYELVQSPEIDEENDFVLEGRVYEYVYRALNSDDGEDGDDGEVKPPVNPDDGEDGEVKPPVNPDDGEDDETKPPVESDDNSIQNDDTKEPIQTGDTMSILPFALAAIMALFVITVATYTRKRVNK